MKVSEILSEGPLVDKLKSMFGTKKKDVPSSKLEDLTDEDRAMITKIIPHNNSDLTWSGNKDGKYVLPTNVTAYVGRGRINFYKVGGVIHADVGYYRSSSDAQNIKVSPLVHFDEKISSIEDLKKLKTKLEE